MTELTDYRKLWNFRDPVSSEAAFRKLMEDAKIAADRSYYLIVKTQLARTFSLRLEIDTAKGILEEVKEELIPNDPSIVDIHFNLEYGRSLNSNKQQDAAMDYFLRAMNIAKNLKQEALEVDAIHMLGIAASTPEKKIEWNRMAIEKAAASDNPDVSRWLGPLYNNTAWTLFDLGNISEAKELFERDYSYRLSNNRTIEALIALWSVARMERALDNIDLALEIQLQIKREREEKDLDPSGYNFEELGEIYLLKQEEDKMKYYFGLAYELLSQDIWLQKNEQKRLSRIKELSG